MSHRAREFRIFILAVVLGLGWAVWEAATIPSIWWFRVGQIEATSGVTVDDVSISYPRQIVQTFNGAWRPKIFVKTEYGWSRVWAGEWTEEVYVGGSSLPSFDGMDQGTVPLRWFICPANAAGCPPDLPEGEYRLWVDWRVNTGEFFLERDIDRRADFAITGSAL